MIQKRITLLRLGRHRFRSDADYRRFQAYQGVYVVNYLAEQGVNIRNTRGLDLGCGNGGYSFALTSAGAHIVSIDFKQPETVPPTFVVGNAIQLPFAFNSFPLVFCASLIEHVSDPALLLTEMKRVLTPDGVAYLSFPPFYTPVGGHQFKPYHLLGERWALRLSKHKADSYATCFGDFGLYPMTIHRVRQLLAEAGLTIKHESTRFFPLAVSRIPVLGEFLT
jgi:SAM-dependent methyltransferase